MAAHARLKNELTEDEKYHNLMSWLICSPRHYRNRPFNLTLQNQQYRLLPLLALVYYRYYDVASQTETLTRKEVAELNIRRDYSLVVNAVGVSQSTPMDTNVYKLWSSVESNMSLAVECSDVAYINCLGNTCAAHGVRFIA